MKIKSAAKTLGWFMVGSYILLATSLYGTAQPRRGVSSTQKPAVKTEAKEALPTLDTLLAAETFLFYLEVRGVGQVLQPTRDYLQLLGGQSVEVQRITEWAGEQAEALATARMLCGLSSTKPKLPPMVCGFEFSSPEEAKGIEAKLKELLPKLLPSKEPPATSSAPPNDNPNPPAPIYFVKQVGSLLLVSNATVNHKDLRPAGHRLLSDHEGFRAARNRFASESLFLYYDMAKTQQPAVDIASVEAPVTSIKQEAAPLPPPPESSGPPPASEEQSTKSEVLVVESGKNPSPDSDAPSVPAVSIFSFFNLFMYGPGAWPDGVALALSFEGDTVIARVLTSNRDGSQAAAIPFVPSLIPGPAIAPGAAAIFPADTEIFLTASLDFAKIYDALMKTASAKEERFQSRVPAKARDSLPAPEFESPFAPLERQLGLNLKEDLMPLLGNEVAIALPLSFLDGPKPPVDAAEQKVDAGTQPDLAASLGSSSEQATVPDLAVALSVKNREAVKELIPRVIESLGFKGAAAWAQTEKREDTELISYAKVISFAFIADYLVISQDPATVRRIVEAYLRHETLASNSTYRNSTRWQPRQLHGQLYVSPALIESYKTPKDYRGVIDQKMLEFVNSLNPTAEPTTYSLVNESVGTVHEVRVPKDLLKLFFFGATRALDASETTNNESIAAYALMTLARAQQKYKESKGNGKFGHLEELFTDAELERVLFERYGYRYSLIVTDSGFEATAYPEEYGKTGKLSFFIDQTSVLRAADHGGSPANVTDKPY